MCYIRYGTLATYSGSCTIPQKGTMPHPDALKVNLQSEIIALSIKLVDYINVPIVMSRHGYKAPYPLLVNVLFHHVGPPILST